jgi:integrase
MRENAGITLRLLDSAWAEMSGGKVDRNSSDLTSAAVIHDLSDEHRTAHTPWPESHGATKSAIVRRMGGKSRLKKERKKFIGKTSPSARSRPISVEVAEALANQIEAFRQKFGREMGPNDPLFFDPDAETPLPISEEQITRDVTEAMHLAGIDERRIYAYRKTGMLISETNLPQWSAKDLAEYQAALDAFDSLQ